MDKTHEEITVFCTEEVISFFYTTYEKKDVFLEKKIRT